MSPKERAHHTSKQQTHWKWFCHFSQRKRATCFSQKYETYRTRVSLLLHLHRKAETYNFKRNLQIKKKDSPSFLVVSEHVAVSFNCISVHLLSICSPLLNMQTKISYSCSRIRGYAWVKVKKDKECHCYYKNSLTVNTFCSSLASVPEAWCRSQGKVTICWVTNLKVCFSSAVDSLSLWELNKKC